MSNDIPLTAKNLRRVPKDLLPVVKNAAKMGWTGRKHGNGGLLLHSPDGHTQVTIPITVSSRSATTNIARQILRATPKQNVVDQVVEAERQVYGGATGEALDTVTALGAAEGPLGIPLDALVDSGEAAPEVPDVTGPQDQAQDTVVSVTPFLARAKVRANGTADLYASQAINARHWSSGKVDYACAFPGCDYTADQAGSVRGHRRKHRTPHTPDRTTVAREENPQPLYRPRAARLAREITEAMAQVPEEGLSREEYARALAEHILTRRHEQGSEPVEETPRTPEQVLARIRAMLMPDLLANEEQMRTRAQELAAQVDHFRSQAEAAQAAADRYKETLAALASLAQEEGELDG